MGRFAVIGPQGSIDFTRTQEDAVERASQYASYPVAGGPYYVVKILHRFDQEVTRTAVEVSISDYEPVPFPVGVPILVPKD